MSWSVDLTRIANKSKADIGKFCRAVKIELFSGVVSDTRHDTGRLRGNWQIQENVKPVGDIDRLDKHGVNVNAEIAANASPDGVTYFVNNLPYAKVWEERDGMVARNAARIRHIVSALARK